MAAVSSFLSESTFRFEVGPEKQVFHIHPSITKDLSQPLYQMMTNGKLSESVNGCASLPECQPNIFQFFCNEAYALSSKHDSRKRKRDAEGDVSRSTEVRCMLFCRWCGAKVKGDKLENGNAYFPFCNSTCRLGGTTMHEDEEHSGPFCTKCRDVLPRENYRPGIPTSCFNCEGTVVELSHVSKEDLVKLYVFSDMYLIEHMKRSCVSEMALQLAKTGKSSIDEVLSLIREVYSQTAGLDDDGIDPMRLVVGNHVVAHARAFRASEDFMGLMGEGGKIVRDVMDGLLDV